jgi:hypothetical protein
MAISLLGDTKIGIIDDVFPIDKVMEFYELVTWAAEHGFKLTHTEGEDFALVEEGKEDQTMDDHYNEWDHRNYAIHMYPSHYRVLSDELSNVVAGLFEEYLDIVGVGRDTPYRTISFDVIHLIKPSDGIDEHIDCFDYGLVFYIGASEDYSGGDLYFPDLGVTLPMVPNRLIIIPAHLRHGVHKVESGIRVSMTTFVPLKKA